MVNEQETIENEQEIVNEHEILEKLKRAIETWDPKMAHSATLEALDAGMEPRVIIENGLGRGMVTISDQFDEAKIYLPQVLAASNAMDAAMKALGPKMSGGNMFTKGTVVLGTIQGDIHEIGKNVIVAMLRGSGYNLYDLGRDVPPEKFIEVAKEKGAKLIGASALMTTTMIGQKVIIELLEEESLREDIKTIFGGAPVTKQWVDSFGGDAYCPSGAEALTTVEKLFEK